MTGGWGRRQSTGSRLTRAGMQVSAVTLQLDQLAIALHRPLNNQVVCAGATEAR